MIKFSDRISTQKEANIDVQKPHVLKSIRLEVALKTRKACVMQCIGECSCRPEPCRNQCFCVSFCKNHK